MTPRTLKEVAQAGLVLGFEWIARDPNGETYMYTTEPYFVGYEWRYRNGKAAGVVVVDYTDLPPERSLLRLRDIVEGKV